jgi:hypothetical protein
VSEHEHDGIEHTHDDLPDDLPELIVSEATGLPPVNAGHEHDGIEHQHDDQAEASGSVVLVCPVCELESCKHNLDYVEKSLP